MQSIGLLGSQENFGGLYGLALIDTLDIEGIFEPNYIYTPNHNLAAAIPLRAGKSAAGIGFTIDSGDASYTYDGDGVFDYTIEVSIPKHTPEIGQWIDENLTKDFVCIIVNMNQQAQVFGSSNYPMRMSIDGKNGKQLSDSNEHVFTFNGKMPYYAKYYQQTPAAPLPTRKIYDNGFDFGYLRTYY